MRRFSKCSDQELVNLLCQRDQQEAMTEIFNRYWLKLLAVAVNRLSNQQEAEECVQDVFLSLWKRRHLLVLKSELSAYLSTAIKYQIINRLDKRYTHKNLATIELKDYQNKYVHSPEAYMFEAELMERIEQTVKQLPKKCQMVYRMSRDEGKSNKEIATTLGMSEKTVEGHITRALRDIRKNLSLIYPMVIVLRILMR
ncbi:RNA polymerase sigma-70 factor [Olivibacter sp. XZL3]|uniref:RNA polymerase sigma-70 factor n=1 Tax=Olivibacter sp. XZL3 TaxID=1735116 RepID=UPI001065D411|nr:RNA polymerase sigma-70 factor [Olivibacter sp. XZL3]